MKKPKIYLKQSENMEESCQSKHKQTNHRIKPTLIPLRQNTQYQDLKCFTLKQDTPKSNILLPIQTMSLSDIGICSRDAQRHHGNAWKPSSAENFGGRLLLSAQMNNMSLLEGVQRTAHSTTQVCLSDWRWLQPRIQRWQLTRKKGRESRGEVWTFAKA